MPDQPGATLELLIAQFTVELGWVALLASDKMVFHTIHCGALEITLLYVDGYTCVCVLGEGV